MDQNDPKSAGHNPGFGRFITYSHICVNCKRKATITLVEAEVHDTEIHIKFFSLPCPCLALRKGITSEIPEKR